MPIEVTWAEIAIRLLCTVAAGGLIGLNRTEHGRAAGLRTSILVALAACIAMVQVNLLLPLAGRSPNSFVMNDLMRLPLGILSGMGFIGAGAIVRRDNLVMGVTTAATLWFLTVIGLCFGGGQIVLGLVGTALGLIVLAGFKLLEEKMAQDRHAEIAILTNAAGPDENEIREILQRGRLTISSFAFTAEREAGKFETRCHLHWRVKPMDVRMPEVVRLLSSHEGVVRVAWTPQEK